MIFHFTQIVHIFTFKLSKKKNNPKTVTVYCEKKNPQKHIQSQQKFSGTKGSSIKLGDLQSGRYCWNPGSLYILVPRRGERHKGLNSVDL